MHHRTKVLGTGEEGEVRGTGYSSPSTQFSVNLKSSTKQVCRLKKKKKSGSFSSLFFPCLPAPHGFLRTQLRPSSEAFPDSPGRSPSPLPSPSGPAICSALLTHSWGAFMSVILSAGHPQPGSSLPQISFLSLRGCDVNASLIQWKCRHQVPLSFRQKKIITKKFIMSFRALLTFYFTSLFH